MKNGFYLTLLAVFLLGFGGLMFSSGKIDQPIKVAEVRGDSLTPLLKAGDEIKIIYGYYNAHTVNKEDIVVYKYAGNDVPIIKIVKAVPQDKWRLEFNETGGFYRIIVNDEVIKNSEGKDYQISESEAKMLKLYTKNYPVLPEGAYLILGNQVTGSLDATKFGLVGKRDILGKVVNVK